ncbi:MAG: tandem-95 repeat protein [Deltaproteobacteria bacterium]|nr:tandem-95 repeat protein [Deltaproteobacteria bacterium]
MRQLLCALLVIGASACSDEDGQVVKFEVRDVAVTTAEDTPLSVQVPVTANTQVQATVTTQPAHGTITTDSGGAAAIYTYTPTADYSGPDRISVSFNNGDETLVGNIDITVTPVNDSPIAAPDSFASGFAAPLTVTTTTLLMNDSDVDGGGALTVTGVAAGTHGSVSLNGGNVVFMPEAGYQGIATFTYTVSDGSASAHGDVTVTIGNNTPPIATPDTVAGMEDTAAMINIATLLANDTDPNMQTLAILGVSNATRGTASIVGTQVRFVPDGNYFGPATFQYTVTDGADTSLGTVTVNLAAVNDAPLVVNDSGFDATEDTMFTFTAAQLIGNDTDVDGDNLRITAVSNAVGGVVALPASAVGDTVTFTPTPNYNGVASFTYTVSDGTTTATGTVSMTIAAVNDAPVAVNDTRMGTEDTVATIPASALTGNDTDVDGDTVTVTAVSGATNGTVSLTGGNVTFTPPADYNGPASFTYTISDGTLSSTATVTLTIAAVNDAPLAFDDTLTTNEDVQVVANIGINDIDIDGPALTASTLVAPTNGTVTYVGTMATYVPSLNFSGQDSFTYTLSDGAGGTSTAVVSITVFPVNDPPVVTNDTVGVAEDGTVTLDPVANDTDVDGGALSIVSITTPANGTATFTGNNVTYTPAANYNGADSIRYTVSDGAGGQTTGTITIGVGPVNDAPQGFADVYSMDEDVPLVISAAAGTLANDTDVDNASLSAVLVTTPSFGDVVFNANGSFTYTVRPNEPCNLVDSFLYYATDGQLMSQQITVTIQINRTPLVQYDYFYLPYDYETYYNDTNTPSYPPFGTNDLINRSVLENDFDMNGDLMTAQLVQGPQSASNFQFNSDGTFNYTFASNQVQYDEFTYVVTDGVLTSDVSTVYVTNYDYCGANCNVFVTAAGGSTRFVDREQIDRQREAFSHVQRCCVPDNGSGGNNYGFARTINGGQGCIVPDFDVLVLNDSVFVDQ